MLWLLREQIVRRLNGLDLFKAAKLLEHSEETDKNWESIQKEFLFLCEGNEYDHSGLSDFPDRKG